MSDNGRQWAFALLFRRFVHKQYLIPIHCKAIPGFQIIQLLRMALRRGGYCGRYAPAPRVLVLCIFWFEF